MIAITGYTVGNTDKAVAFVATRDADKIGVRPLWIPRAKLGRVMESDCMGRRIMTAQNGERMGIPATVEIDADFAAKVGVA
jgi:hypothetical protein